MPTKPTLAQMEKEIKTLKRRLITLSAEKDKYKQKSWMLEKAFVSESFQTSKENTDQTDSSWGKNLKHERVIAPPNVSTDQNSDWVCWIAPDGTCLHTSNACEAICGYKADEIIQNPMLIRQMIHPEDKAHYMAHLRAEFESKKPQNLEYRIIHNNGQVHWISHSCQPIYAKDGKFLGRRIHHRNITEQKETENSLNRIRQNLEKRIENRTIQLLRLNKKLRLEIDDRKRAERKLHRRDRILKAVTYAAERFLQIAPLENGIQESLARLGYATNVSRVYLSENHLDSEGKLLCSRRYEWTTQENIPQVNASILNNLSLPKNGLSRWIDLLSRGKSIYGLVRNFPAKEQSLLIEQNILSIIITPVFAGKEWWGFIGFEDCRLERQWSAVEIDALRAAANILGHAIVRQKAELQIHTLTRELLKAQDEERKKISNYLHDNVAQDLSTLRINCQTLLVDHQDIPASVILKTSEMAEVLQRSIATIRDLAYDLRPPGLDQLGLIAAISMLCEDFSKKTKIQVDFNSAGIDKLSLDMDTEINLYRLIQEGLNNIRKHADATKISIRLVSSFPKIILRIQDNGKGFNVEERLSAAINEKRMGLRSMQERVNLLEGQMTIQSLLNKGTKISIEIPIQKNMGKNSENDESIIPWGEKKASETLS